MAKSEGPKVLNPKAREFFPQNTHFIQLPPAPFPHLHFPPPPPPLYSNPFIYYTTTATTATHSPLFHSFYHTTSTEPSHFAHHEHPLHVDCGPEMDSNGAIYKMGRFLSGRKRFGKTTASAAATTHHFNRRFFRQRSRKEVDDHYHHHDHDHDHDHILSSRSCFKYNKSCHIKNNKVETSSASDRIGLSNKKTMKKKNEVLPVIPGHNNTTLMIKNIPSKFTQMLSDFLDDHCKSENRKVAADGVEDHNHQQKLHSAFDFLYLPMDFKSRLNKGYAFVNFTEPEAAFKFYNAKNNQTWNHFQSSKIREIATARLQGKEELVKHFEKMGFACESDEMLPVCYSPPRDGTGKRVRPRTIGRRLL